jgi:alkylated DNA repair dioxygenase AlkB
MSRCWAARPNSSVLARDFKVRKSVRGGEEQADLFEREAKGLPGGFCYQTELIEPAVERALLPLLTRLPFQEFEFHGFQAKRRVVWFGWRYDFNGGGLRRTEEPLPSFLTPLRVLAAAYAQIKPADLQQVLVTEYRPGAAIGWHRDRSDFGIVVGLSLLSPCRFRLRRKAGGKWERVNLTLAPRSIYVLSGASRSEWEHSIPAVPALRYSITFRNVLNAARS